MKHWICTIAGCLLLSINSLCGQKVAKTEIEKLQVKSGYLLMGGVVCIAAGAIITGFGVHNFQMGGDWEGTIGNPQWVDYRPLGRKLLSVGAPVLAGGIVMLSLGAHYRILYIDKKQGLALKTGLLDDGTAGIAMNF